MAKKRDFDDDYEKTAVLGVQDLGLHKFEASSRSAYLIMINGRTVGRYRQQWYWSCTICGAETDPATAPAASIIDAESCPSFGSIVRSTSPQARGIENQPPSGIALAP